MILSLHFCLREHSLPLSSVKVFLLETQCYGDVDIEVMCRPSPIFACKLHMYLISVLSSYLAGKTSPATPILMGA